MRRAHQGVGRVLALLLVLASAAAAQAPPRLKLAQDLARAHSVWQPGRDWLEQHRAKADKLVVPVLNRCVPDDPDGELTAFTVYLRLSKTGEIREIVADIDDQLGRCMTTGAREVRLPAPPREDFWIQLNLAATL